MTTQHRDTRIQAKLTVLAPRIEDPEDLEVRVEITNRSPETIRLNGLFFRYATIMLDVRTGDGYPVEPGPPPVPPSDDGKTGRITLAPGEATTLAYQGSEFFGIPPEPGMYQVRFVHEDTEGEHGDWTGSIESDWVNFEIVPPDATSE